jgi:mono/diheme cytochrome c family protein
MKIRGLLVVSLLLPGALSACKVEREPNYDYLPRLNHMMFSGSDRPGGGGAAETNTKNKVFANGLTMQAPPDGTIARFNGPQFVPSEGDEAASAELLPYPFTNTDDSIAKAEEAFRNTVPVAETPDNLARGKEKFGQFCAPCHGVNGGGDGLVGKRAPQFGGWNLDDCAKVAKDLRQADGKFPAIRIFHKITWGADPTGPNANARENMPAYAAQIAKSDRWKIALYIKELQKAAGKSCPL